MIATQMELWRAASVAGFSALEAQTAALAEMRAAAHAQWRAGIAFWGGLNPMLAPVAALVAALDPEVPAAATASACGPVPMAPRRAGPRRKSAA